MGLAIGYISKQVATLLSDKKIDSLKEAYKLCVTALSLLKEALREHPKADISLTDIRTEFFEFQTKYIEAQCQEISSIVALGEGKSPRLLAKLFTGAASLYRDAILFYNSQPIFKTLKYNWPVVINSKMKLCAAIADYMQASDDLQVERYGQGIARIRSCMTHADEGANYLGGKFLPEVGRAFDQIIVASKSILADAQRDNNLIFHEADVKRDELVPIEKVSLIKTNDYKSTLLEFIAFEDKFIFPNVLPMKALELISKYTEEKCKIIRYEQGMAEKSFERFKNVCQTFNLPDGINSVKSYDDIEFDKARKNAIQNQITSGLFQDVLDLRIDLVDDQLSEAIKELELEEIEDKNHRMKSSNFKPTLNEDIQRFYGEIFALKQSLPLLKARQLKIMNEIDSDFINDVQDLTSDNNQSFLAQKIIPQGSDSIISQYHDVIKSIECLKTEMVEFKQDMSRDENPDEIINWDDLNDEKLYHSKLSKYEIPCKLLEKKISLLDSKISDLEINVNSLQMKVLGNSSSAKVLRLKSVLAKAIAVMPHAR